MSEKNLIEKLCIKNEKKIILLIMDGVAGLPINGKTELEAAKTPNLDALAEKSEVGLSLPILPGITPGSGPGHLGVFGYNPLDYEIGRGVLEAVGIGMKLDNKSLAARCNFCTIDKNKIITDRRAGRIPTEKNIELCKKLKENIKMIEDVEVIIEAGKEHRFVVVFRGEGLEEPISDADPQKEGLSYLYSKALAPAAEKSARIVNKFLDKVIEVLKDEHPANAALLRGAAKTPDIPSMEKRFKLKAAAIAVYPMYRGLASLVGMELLDAGQTIKDEIETLKKHYNDYDFFFIHIKKTDSYGEDGNFDNKIHIIEEVDELMPEILKLNPDVLCITADHSTPCLLKAHSWHPVPLLIYSPFVRPSGIKGFNEKECAKGNLGIIESKYIINLLLANALKLNKYGA
ncbi:MAG TPA: 2,3-bisphosphoglycerate-independent phosphoglycerate mutase [bacterium]|nr:2,3-bisphosphoglycerate-independent phosphoglycerate mutase [bacterium]HOL48618.1 2,3-bisphosphoglycerate-independent phosphoglycerate mutase [bacterium]HPQ19041.1 2,3-bisphosphoglycerate-independent phosphoglycerate mutase [bacterium]